jgi:hypothetical protein
MNTMRYKGYTASDAKPESVNGESSGDDYDRWFRAKVQKSIDNPAPRIPHDEAMAKLERMLGRDCPKK